MKSEVALILALGLLLSLSGMVLDGYTGPAEAAAANGQDVLERVLSEFYPLANIPRKSHHEEKISAYLVSWAEKFSLKSVKDKSNNVVIEVPATRGMENKPLVILQAHSDMVCVAADGVRFDPLADPIKVIRDDKARTLKADGTSLGADDGIGVAMALFVANPGNKVDHGPLRLVITTNEEDGMTGAANLDATHLEGKYLVNLDNEVVGQFINSCAGGYKYIFTDKVKRAAPKKDLALAISLSGLLGGHSGIEINKGHANAVSILANLLNAVHAAGIDFELASFEGGTAANAIPAKAAAVMVIDSRDRASFEKVFDSYKGKFERSYGGIEKNGKLAFSKTALPKNAAEPEAGYRFISLLASIPTGVGTMSQVVKDLVESSSNTGIVALGGDSASITIFARSSEDYHLERYTQNYNALATLSGYQLETIFMGPPWPAVKENKLAETLAAEYQALTGKTAEVLAIHAGLECAYWAQKNPGLSLISIGPELHDVHSPNETLFLDSIAPTVDLLVAAMKKLD